MSGIPCINVDYDSVAFGRGRVESGSVYQPSEVDLTEAILVESGVVGEAGFLSEATALS